MSHAICPSCGHKVADNVVFCPFCGLPQNRPQAPTTLQPTAPEWSAVSPLTPSVRYASFWIRFTAAAIDNMLLWFVTWAVIIPMALLSGDSEAAQMSLGFVYIGVSIVAPWLYEAYFLSSERQATLGKSAVGVIVTDEAGQRISFQRATGRYFGKILSSLTLLVGYLIQPFTDRRQALHDMLAGTVVLKR